MSFSNLIEFREWVAFGAELYICGILTLEYFYDANKDAKKTRRTKTTKKTTKTDGSVTEEHSEEVISPEEEKI